MKSKSNLVRFIFLMRTILYVKENEQALFFSLEFVAPGQGVKNGLAFCPSYYELLYIET